MFTHFIDCITSDRGLPVICLPDGFPMEGRGFISACLERDPVVFLCPSALSVASWTLERILLSSAHWWGIIYVDSTPYRLPSASFALPHPSSLSCIAFGCPDRSLGIGMERRHSSARQQQRSHTKPHTLSRRLISFLYQPWWWLTLALYHLLLHRKSYWCTCWRLWPRAGGGSILASIFSK